MSSPTRAPPPSPALSPPKGAAPKARPDHVWFNVGHHAVTFYRRVTTPRAHTGVVTVVETAYEREPTFDVPAEHGVAILALAGAPARGSPDMLLRNGEIAPSGTWPTYTGLVAVGRAPNEEPRPITSVEDFVRHVLKLNPDEVTSDLHDFIIVTNALVGAWLREHMHTNSFVRQLVSTFRFVGPNTDGVFAVRNANGQVIGTTQFVVFNGEHWRREHEMVGR